MTTQNSLGLGLVGNTGTGNFVGAISPILVTPAAGNASATSLNFGASATNGLIGINGGTSASSGVVGELIQSNIPSGSAVSLTTNVAKNLTTLSLTAGEWDLYGNIMMTNSTSALSYAIVWISLTSALAPDVSLRSYIRPAAQFLSNVGLSTPYIFFRLNTTTTVYLSGRATFASGTTTMCGNIYARRAR